MFDEIKAWLEGDGRSPSRDGTDEVQIAAAALLVEAAHIDDEFDMGERAVIDRILERRFKLTPAAARRLVVAAEEISERSTQLFRFTRIINERFSLDQRIELLEMLWEVVYADGTVDALEDTLLRRSVDCSTSPTANEARRDGGLCKVGRAARPQGRKRMRSIEPASRRDRSFCRKSKRS